MQQRLSIVTLGVDSLRRAKRFYLEGLGWSEVDQPSDEIVFIQMNAMVLGLFPRHALADDIGLPAGETENSGAPNTAITLAYNTNSREETDDVLRIAVDAGATLIKPAQEVFWGGYSGYFADPDGHLWEVAHNPFTEPAADGSFWMT